MRHGIPLRKRFGGGKSARKMLFKRLASNLIDHETIRTSVAKAKFVRPDLEKVITIAKSNLPVYMKYTRCAACGIKGEAAKKLINDIAVRYKDRNGGYIRIIRNGFNTAANPVCVFQLV